MTVFGALSDIRIIDLTQMLAGADVIDRGVFL